MTAMMTLTNVERTFRHIGFACASVPKRRIPTKNYRVPKNIERELVERGWLEVSEADGKQHRSYGLTDAGWAEYQRFLK